MKQLNVWTAGVISGVLHREQNYVFNYAQDTPATHAVSLTMPVRAESYVYARLHPVFQVNFPEGALLSSIKNAIAKIAGSDDLTLLQIVGSNLIGRNRFAPVGEPEPNEGQKPEPLRDILKYPNTQELFRELLEKYALRSGVSGIQPKVLLEASDRTTIYSSSYIVKYSGADYPFLAVNEYLCMKAVKAAALPVSDFHLSEDGNLFIMKRFDVTGNDGFLGFEDFCALQGLNTEDKYRGSYERAIQTIAQYVSPELQGSAKEQFFRTLVLSVIVRNGDAHLKNFGILYDNPMGKKQPAPVYDIVTTVAYLKNDVPALTLEGTKKWWDRKTLVKFGGIHCGISSSKAQRMIEQVCDSVSKIRKDITKFAAKIPGFAEIGKRMVQAWDQGLLLRDAG